MDDWRQANHEWLLAAIRVLRDDLDAVGFGAAGDGDESERPELVRERDRRSAAMSASPALDVLAEIFDLSRFEREILLLCAGTELDGDLATACAGIQRTEDHYNATFSLALASLPEPHWDAIAPTSPLRRWHLIDVAEASSLALAPLRVDERVLHYLTGADFLDPDLGAQLPAIDARDLVPSLRSQAALVAESWESDGARLVEIHGPWNERATCVAAAAAESGLRLTTLPASAVPTDPAKRVRFARRWEREMFLADAVLMIECDAIEPNDHERLGTLQALAEDVAVPVVYAWDRPSPLVHRTHVTRVEVSTPPRAEQRGLWRTLLDEHENAWPDVDLDGIVAQFDLAPSMIRAAADLAGEAAAAHDPPVDDPDVVNGFLWEACRRQSRTGIIDLATRLDARASWDDLVLPHTQMEILHGIANQLRHRMLVYEEWGFGDRLTRGLGVAALFSGTSGTGKTMAAEVIANDLGLDLFVVDLSMIMNKYIGETEKNLRRVFDAAERSGAILLFDEADSLFGKRGEVKDSHDRYANIGVSYLLTRMETYRGLAILTTNRREGIDEAFIRRLRFVVEFPFPDKAMRERIIEKAFPPDAPLGDVDLTRLAELDISGGLIRNIALGAAFSAAHDGTPIEMRHIAASCRAEFAKSGRTVTVDLDGR